MEEFQDQKIRKMMMYREAKANSTTIWITFLFLGWSYGSLDQMGKQVLFYFTLGGLGLWTIYRLFTLESSIKKHNKKIATMIGIDDDQMSYMRFL